MNKPERIIIRPGGVGDTLLLAPALSRLREQGESCITLVGYPSRLEPLAQAGLADRIIPLDDFLTLPASDWGRLLGGPGTPENASAPGRQYVRVDSCFSALPPGFVSLPGVHLHDPFPPEDRRIHVAEYLASCVGVALPLERSSPLRSLLGPQRGKDPCLWIHPGSGGKAKRWPLKSFLLIAEELPRMIGARAVFLLGEAERDLEEEIRMVGYGIQRPSTLLDLSALFASGDWFLGNDSGPSHLAALMGLDTVAVFGPTDPDVWGPWGERARVVRAEGTETWIEPGEVLEKARQWWFDPST